MEAAYLTAAYPKRRKVLGQVLEPFSLGHAHLLAAIGNSYAPTYYGPQHLADLPEAVFICSHPYEKAKRAHASRLKNFKIWVWAKTSRKFNPIEEGDKFVAYSSTDFPRLWRGENSRESLATPLLQLIRVVHLAHLCSGEIEAMEKPFNLALRDYCAFFEIGGKLKMVTEEDEELIQDAMRIARENNGV